MDLCLFIFICASRLADSHRCFSSGQSGDAPKPCKNLEHFLV